MGKHKSAGAEWKPNSASQHQAGQQASCSGPALASKSKCASVLPCTGDKGNSRVETLAAMAWKKVGADVQAWRDL